MTASGTAATASDVSRHGGRRLNALYVLAAELSQLRDLNSVLRTALAQCLDLTDSQFGFIGLNTPDGRMLDVVAILGFDAAPDFYKHLRMIPLRPNLFANAVLQRRPVRSTDALLDPARVGQPSGHPAVHTFLGVPLLVQNEAIGMIGVANRATPYLDENESLLATYAAQVAIAIHNARLNDALDLARAELEQKVQARTHELAGANTALETARDALAQKAEQLQRLLADTVAAEERERQRIAHALHDGPNQLLVGAMLQLQAAHEQIEGGDYGMAQTHVDQVQQVLQQLEHEMRKTIRDLRPPVLDALGLVPSLRRAVEDFARANAMPASFDVYGTPYRLQGDAEIVIYRVLQEALNNVARHARARHVSVDLNFEDQHIHLAIRDDGRGFEPAMLPAMTGEHFGVAGMRERLDMIGGKLGLSSTPGGGTRLEIWVPA